MGKSQPKTYSLESIMNKILTKNAMQKAKNHAHYHQDKYRCQSFDQNQPSVSKQAVVFKVQSGISKH